MLARRLRSALAAAALLLTGHALAGERRPDWVDGESLEWPRHRYVLGVGSADDRATSEDRARAEIARVFAARVSSTTASFAAEATARSSGGAVKSAQVSVSDDTRSTTDKVLEGTEIAATWQDPATHQVFALAVLDRRRAAERLRARLVEIEGGIRPLEAELSGSADRVASALAGLRLVALAQRRQPLVADLRVVANGGDEAAPRFAQLTSRAREALARLVVAASAQGEGGAALEEGLARGLATLGVRAAPAAPDQTPDLIVEAQGSYEDLGRRDGWAWCRARASVSVREANGGRVLVRFDESAREAATLEGDARHRAAAALTARVADHLATDVLSWSQER